MLVEAVEKSQLLQRDPLFAKADPRCSVRRFGRTGKLMATADANKLKLGLHDLADFELGAKDLKGFQLDAGAECGRGEQHDPEGKENDARGIVVVANKATTPPTSAARPSVAEMVRAHHK
jgi:hypothetical protein